MTSDPDALTAFIKRVLAASAPLDSETAALLAPLLPLGQVSSEPMEERLGELTLTPEQRSLHARIAAHSRWGQTDDTVAATAKARAAAEGRFERQADPEGVLSPDVRARKASNLRTAFYLKLSAAGVKARQRRNAE